MENIKADHASNGKIAVGMFERSNVGDYAAILMDVRMPEADVQQSLPSGMNAHLTKPVETEPLIRTPGKLVYEAEEARPKARRRGGSGRNRKNAKASGGRTLPPDACCNTRWKT